MGPDRSLGEPQGSLVGAPCDEDLSRVSSGARVPRRLGPEEPGDLEVDRAFQALGDANRRAILAPLSRAPSSASKLAGPLNLTVAAVVQHLQVLEESRLVQTEKVGRVRTCRLHPGGMKRVERWIADRRSLWDRRLDRLGDVLVGYSG